MKKLTQEEFIKRANEIHENRYIYDKVVYVNSYTHVIITCPIHGDFLVTPNRHIGKEQVGCPECFGSRLNTERFISRAREVHGDKYTYNKVIYTGYTKKVIITCPIHGDFEQVASYHLSGNGCPMCGRSTKTITQEEFLLRAREVHGDRYDYSKVNYINTMTPITIICPIHGEFEQLPSHHIHLKQGCPNCAHDKLRLTTDEFIKSAQEIHGDKYSYEHTIYINNYTPVIITCPIHGDFEQTPSNHLKGWCGCPQCFNRSKLEETVKLYLERNNISFIEQMTWDWLKYKKQQSVDFFLPDQKVAIECQGLQHFRKVGLFDKMQPFEERWKLDTNKQQLCLSNGVVIYYYSNLSRENSRFNYPYLVFENMDNLMEEINNSQGLLLPY